MRKLASVQTVDAVEPVPSSDNLERARVLGWWVVVKKGEYRPGDRVVYAEIDSLLPERPEFEFLRAGSYKPAQVGPDGVQTLPAGFRVKTVRLRGQVSQGICFPLSVLPPGTPAAPGDDVTDALGVLKWDPAVPAEMEGKAKGGFPGFVSKTDETRIQAVPALLDRYRGKTFYATEKLDGTSVTLFVRGGEFGVCGRSWQLDEADGSSPVVRLVRALDLEARLRAAAASLGFDLAVQGELVGPGVRKNKYALPGLNLFAFTVENLSTGTRLPLGIARSVASGLGLASVPDVAAVTLDHTVDELVAFAEGPSAVNPKVHREGLVFRPPEQVIDADLGGRLSFKVINPKFLLKYDE